MKPEIRPRGTTGSLSGAHQRGSGSLRAPLAPLKEPGVDERTAETAPTMLGRKLSNAEFNTAMVHFYRGEVQRSNTWRNRLDTTTNWAVITAGATLSFAFSSPNNPHFVIPINSVLVAFFLFMEARRYRYYEIWANRVRVIETGYFAQLLSPDNTNDQEWVHHLAGDLKTPHFTISEWEAVGRRLRRNYLWIFALLAASWNLKVYLHPQPAHDFDEFIARASIGFIPGAAMFLFGIIFNTAVLIFAFATVRLREATGEVLPEHEFHPIRRMTTTITRATQRQRVTERRTKKARVRTRTGRTIGTLTGEFKRPDTGDVTHHTEAESIKEETLT